MTNRRVAMIGNPNTGKTSLFNALTGLAQRVGNYPGVTVEKKVGNLSKYVEVIDLPGTYSLAAWSPDEMVAARVLLGDLEGEVPPDLAVVVIDAENLRRNLYLVTQVMETGVPVIVALNMVDLAEKSGVRIDVEGLGRSLGVPVVPTVGFRREGVDALRRAIEENLGEEAPKLRWDWPEVLAREADSLGAKYPARPYYLRRALIDMGGAVQETLATKYGEEVVRELNGVRNRVREETGSTPAVLEAEMRHEWIGRAMEEHVEVGPPRRAMTDRIDRFLTQPVFGTAAFVIVMAVVFISIFEWASPFMDLIDGLFSVLGTMVAGWFAGTAAEGGMLESFLVNGVIAGLGGVLIFLPQIAILFLFISILEDCGYLSRAAFLMDRVLRLCGLSGHSFIPLLSSFACAVPGIMATRTISDGRDRLLTILVAPLMSCSARLPVYAILIAAFVPSMLLIGFVPLQGLVLGLLYLMGIVVAVIAAVVLRKTAVRGPAADFVMELPPYRIPSWRNVGLRVYDRSKDFTVKAGTIIFAMSIVVWALGYFPRSGEVLAAHEEERAAARRSAEGEELETRLADIDNRERGAMLRASFLGRMGRAVEPVVRPLGWDWRIGMGVIAAFPAREVVVSTLGIVYDLGEEGVEEEEGLVGKLRGARWPDGRVVFTLPVALGLMVFFALCCQCGATVATIRRETNSWRWAIFAFTYLTVLAYAAAWATYRIAQTLST